MYIVVLVILSIIALLFVLLPYFKAADAGSENAPDIDVYKAQLRELEIEVQRGLIDEDEAKRSRLEIERRLLKAAEAGAIEVNMEKPDNFMAAVLAVVLLTSSGFYLMLGTPGMPDFPKSLDGGVQFEESDAERVAEIKSMIARVTARLAERPEEAEGWAFLANQRMSLGEFQAAAEALYNAHLLKPDEFDYQLMYAEGLIAAAGQRVTPAAKIILNKAVKMNPEHPAARYYLGLADFQAGDIELAYENWQAVKAGLAGDEPIAALLDAWIGRAEAELGLAQSVPAGRAPSISSEQAETIQNMSDDEQQELIRQMVAQLAAKQEENPGNIQGWLQLSRSYMVLGQREDAIAAMQSAVDNAPDDQKEMLQKEVEKLTNLP